MLCMSTLNEESMSTSEISRNEKRSRCIALEEDYVQQVYEKIGKDLMQARDPLELPVKNFLDDLEPGSLVADIGCGDGKHLRNTNGIFSLGADSSCLQASLARQRCQEALLGDNLRLPFRSDVFDAVLSMRVIHHFTTRERRIKALKELTRILRVGGRILIAVQRHNTQNSQDVLIPWYDVPKEKRNKYKCWLEQDSGEYELEDDIGGGDDDDDDDSISLFSSDEDDAPVNIHAKLIPPYKQAIAKRNWSSNRLSRSLDYDYQTSSNNVPNSKQLVQNNTCYAFVRKALKRFSSINAPDEDQSIKSELHHRVDSAIPPSPTSAQEQIHDPLNDSSLDLNSCIEKTLSDNFIELLNIDDDTETSSSQPKRDCTYESLHCSDSKHASPLYKNKSSLIRSLSDIFKNMNSLWSSKETKSCSDLKSHAGFSDNNIGRKKQKESRLVRSKTTATCNPEFDYFSSLEDIEELEMTISEANKIINDFLDSSMPDEKPDVRKTKDPDKEKRALLTHCDIVNGNIVPSITDLSTNTYIPDIPTDLRMNECMDYFEEKNVHSVKSDQLNLQNIVDKSDICHAEISKERKICSKNDFTKFEANGLEDVNSSFSLRYREDTSSKHGNIPRNPTNKTNFKSINTVIEKHISNEDEVSHPRKQLSEGVNKKDFEFDYPENNLKYLNNLELLDDIQKHETIQKFENSNLMSTKMFTNLETTEQIHDIKKSFQQIDNSFNYRHLQNSPKRNKEQLQNYKCQMAGSKTLGPFYDEDNDLFFEEYDNLSSYCSMPELHALSDFSLEYRIYQNNLTDKATLEKSSPSKCHAKLAVKESNTYTVDQIQKDSFEVEKNLNIKEINNFQESNPEGNILEVSLKNNLCTENIKLNTSNSLNSELKPSSVDFFINSLSNQELCNDIFVQNGKFTFLSPNISKRISSEFLNTKKCCSLSSFHSENNNVQSIRSYALAEIPGVPRSHSISTLCDSIKERIFPEKCTLSELSASQDFRILSHKRENSNLNLNQLKLKQMSSHLLNSISGLGENDVIDTDGDQQTIPPLQEDICNNYTKSALNQISKDSLNSVSETYNFAQNVSNFSNFGADFNKYECTDTELKTSDKNSSLHSIIHSEEILYPIMNEVYAQKISLNTDGFEKSYDIAQDPKNTQSNLKCRNITKNRSKDLSFKDNFNASLLISQNMLKDGSTNSLHNKLKCNVKDIYNQDASPNCFSDFKSPRVSLNCSEDSNKSTHYLRESNKIPSSKLNDSDIGNNIKRHFHEENSMNKQSISIRSENISECQPDSSLHQNQLVCSNADIHIGAIRDTNVEMPITTKFNTDILSADSSSSISKINEAASISSNLSDHIKNDKQFKQRDSDNIKSSYQENISYACGRIHEEGAVVVGHRYHHLFEEDELDDLIENNISDLHVLNSFQHETHFCIIAEKVRVWMI